MIKGLINKPGVLVPAFFFCILFVIIYYVTSPSPVAPTPGPAPAVSEEEPVRLGLSFESIDFEGETFRYAVYVPTSVDFDSAAPLIVFLHGRMESGLEGVRQTSVGLFPAVLSRPEKWPFVLLMPQKPEQSQTWASLEPAVMAMLTRERGRMKIDPNRIYLSGLSQGGAGTWAIAARHPDVFAAIAPVCGFADDADIPVIARGLTAMPIWAFHGQKDQVIPYTRSVALVDAVKAAQGSVAKAPEPKLTIYPDADHNSWDNAYRNEELAEWLLTHRRGQ